MTQKEYTEKKERKHLKMGIFNVKTVKCNGNYVKVNGKTYAVDGDCQNVSVVNGHVYINGKELEETKELQCVKLIINGNVGNITTSSADVEVFGTVIGEICTTSGNIDINGDVEENVRTTSGNVKAKSINGSVSTISGDISKSFL